MVFRGKNRQTIDKMEEITQTSFSINAYMIKQCVQLLGINTT